MMERDSAFSATRRLILVTIASCVSVIVKSFRAPRVLY